MPKTNRIGEEEGPRGRGEEGGRFSHSLNTQINKFTPMREKERERESGKSERDEIYRKRRDTERDRERKKE